MYLTIDKNAILTEKKHNKIGDNVMKLTRFNLMITGVISFLTWGLNPLVIKGENIQELNSIEIAQKNQVKPKNDFIITTNRAGLITDKTTYKDLVKIFGQSKLISTVKYGPEGIGKFLATKINLGKNKSVTVVWKDKKKNKVSYLTDFGTDWQTKDGIKVGTTLAELRKKYGKFTITGLGWDYGGFVLLHKLNLPQYKNISLRVNANEKMSEKYSNDYYKITGDQELSSHDPNWDKFGITVVEVEVFFGE
jgi:hypothetical protein